MSSKGPSRAAQRPSQARKPKSPPKPKGAGRRARGNASGLAAPKSRPKSRSGKLGLGSMNKPVTNKQQQVIEEDEFVAEINGSVAFATTQYPVNIGQKGTFPWGANVAPNYEKYEFDYLEFYYKREVSEYATNGQSGKVMLNFDYDAADGAPTTKQQVLDTVPHVDGMPCAPMLLLPIDCGEAKRADAKYIRTGVQPANTDIKTYDIGNLYVSTQGCTNTTVIGELHVRYRCRLKVPILPSGGAQVGQAGSQLVISSPLLGETAAATTVKGLLFVGATNPVVVQNGIGAVVASTGLITLLAGTYLVELFNTSSDVGNDCTNSSLEIVSTSTLTNYLAINSSYSYTNNGTPANEIFTREIKLVHNTAVCGLVVGAAASVTYAAGTAINNAVMKITQL